MNLAYLLQRIALQDPHRPALLHGQTCSATYAQWAARSAHLAARFRSAGLQPGDRVALFMHNHPRYLEVILGAWWAGLAVVPINAMLHPREAQWIIENAEARWVFVTADVAGVGAQAVHASDRVVDVDSAQAAALWGPSGPDARLSITERAPDDLAWLFYTSGTTGRPKGVMLTQRNLMTMGLGYFVDVDHVSSSDAIVYAGPMSHGAGLYAIPHLMAGARHVVPASGGFDAAELFELGRAVGPLSLFAAPTIVRRIVLQAQTDAVSRDDCGHAFKTIVYGGAPMFSADIERAIQVMGPRFVQIYGQGETPMVATALARAHLLDNSHPRYAQRLASVGVAQSPVQVRVADLQGQDAPHGEVGEVLVRGDTVMAGYWRNPQASAAALRDGWLWTGDMGTLDEDGFLTLKDRSKDLIISGGANIYPREVEDVLLTAPGVAEVAVVGTPDPEWGESVVAFVVPHIGEVVDTAQLDALCLTQIARFKRPKRYQIVDQLPKNNYGKVLKTVLRQRLHQA